MLGVLVADNYDFTFNGTPIGGTVSATGVQFTVSRVEGAGLHGMSVQTAERPGGDGSRLIDSHLSERVIQVQFTLETGLQMSHESMVALDEAERALHGLLYRSGLSELRFPHQGGYFLAKPGGISVDARWEHLLKGTLEFVCPAPFLYGVERTVSPSGGRVQVESNYFVEPVILWTTSASSGAPRIEVDGKRLTIDTQVSAGQQIRIDSARKETRVGGVLNVENIHGIYPQVYDGSTITTSPGGTVQIQYQERWI